MDTNIIGRFHTPYASGGPNITKIVVLDLTKESYGNANGIGLADFTTKRFFSKMRTFYLKFTHEHLFIYNGYRFFPPATFSRLFSESCNRIRQTHWMKSYGDW